MRDWDGDDGDGDGGQEVACVVEAAGKGADVGRLRREVSAWMAAEEAAASGPSAGAGRTDGGDLARLQAWLRAAGYEDVGICRPAVDDQGLRIGR
jgi:hypothetical protein